MTPIPTLVDAWAQAMADIRRTVYDLGPDGWAHPSLLPGWSVGDVVSHLSWIERIMLGRFDGPHEPAWAQLPHVESDFGRLTEIPVDLRRSWSRDAVLAEFDATIADRHAALQAGPQDPMTPAVNPFGKRVTLEAVLRMRIFDTWVHGQDIRLAVGRPGATDTAAARFAAEQIAGALGYVWAKKVGAPAGATLTVTVTPPGVALNRAVAVTDSGKGIDIAPPSEPTIGLTMTFDDFVQLGCGRTRPDSTLDDARTRVIVAGEAGLGARTLAAFDIAP